MSRRPWGEQELAELAAVQPGQYGAIKRHAEKWQRQSGAVSAKMQVLRRRGAAADVGHGTAPGFDRQVRLTPGLVRV